MAKASIFVSSVQKEFSAERRTIREFIESDAVLGRFFDVFLFEDLPAADRRVDEVYLAGVDRCDVYVGLFGLAYGFEDVEGVSPTEREFDRATLQGKHRLLFVKAADETQRHPKMAALLGKAGLQMVWRRFTDASELVRELSRSLADWLEERGLLQNRAFEDRPCTDALEADVEPALVADFVRRARDERQFALAENTPVAEALEHLHFRRDGHPTQAAMLLFGRDPQRYMPAAEMRCMHFHGTEVERPVPFYRIFKGTLFDQVDRAADFVLSVLNRGVGTRAVSTQVPVEYELPPDVVREAIVNAVAHRDYASAAAVQVSVFADRVEVRNPGQLLPPLTPERLREPHGSVARNPRICEALFLAHYIEKFGTGTLMMIRLCRSRGLPEPVFEQQGGEFVVALRRPKPVLVDVLAAGAEGGSESRSESGPESRAEWWRGRSEWRPEWGPESVHDRVMAAAQERPLNRGDLAIALGHKGVSGALRRAITDLMQRGLLAYTVPDKPASRLQRYRAVRPDKNGS